MVCKICSAESWGELLQLILHVGFILLLGILLIVALNALIDKLNNINQNREYVLYYLNTFHFGMTSFKPQNMIICFKCIVKNMYFVFTVYFINFNYNTSIGF